MITTYELMVEAVTAAFVQKLSLYASLSNRAEIKDSTETVQDILTLFSLGPSVLQVSNTNVDESILERINSLIVEYYKRLNNSESKAIGVTMSQNMKDELSDIVHTISPFFEKQTWKSFFDDLPNDSTTRNIFKAVGDDYETMILVIVCAIIKSCCLLQRIGEMMVKPARGKRNGETTNQ